MKLRLKLKCIENGAICLIPQDISYEKRSPCPSKYVDKDYTNVILYNALNTDTNNDHDKVLNSYKNLVKKIHMNLNKMGYRTDSSNLDDLEIKIFPDSPKGINFDVDSEICSGYIFYELCKWHTDIIWQKMCNRNDFKTNIAPVSEKNSQYINGQHNVTYAISFKDIRYYGDDLIQTLYDAYGISEKKSKLYLNEVLKKLELQTNTKLQYNTSYNEFTGSFNNISDKESFEKIANILFAQLKCDIVARNNYISEWFESPIYVDRNNFLRIINPKIVFENKKNVLKLNGDKRTPGITLYALNDKFQELNSNEIITILKKYFKYENSNIILDSEKIDGHNYYDELSKIKLKLKKMIEDLSDEQTFQKEKLKSRDWLN